VSGADTDPLVGLVLSILALVALTLTLPLILVFYALTFVGRGALALGQRRHLDAAVQEELTRIAIERSTAIREIVAIRQRSEREMRALADGRGDRG
jgi:hypothetical protein